MSQSQPPAQLFRITPGPVVYATDSHLDSAHLCEEVDYLTDYASQMAECLGTEGFEVGLVEDSASQTAFYRIPYGPVFGPALVNGVIARGRKRPLSAVLQELWEE